MTQSTEEDKGLFTLTRRIAKFEHISRCYLKIDFYFSHALDAHKFSSIRTGDLLRIGKIYMGTGEPVTKI